MSGEADPYSRIDYRRLIAWPERLRREQGLIEKTLASGPIRRILDLGCGTGEHARFLATRGYEVVGVDSSPSMLAKAREQPPPQGVSFLEGDLRNLQGLDREAFGGALCLGNTLPHLKTDEDLSRFARGLRALLEEGSPLLLQIVNYERIFARGIRHLPLNIRPDERGEVVFLRLMQPQDDGRILFFPSTLRLDPEADPPLELLRSKRVELRGWRAPEVEAALREAGFPEQRRLGAFDESPYEPQESPDLILVAR